MEKARLHLQAEGGGEREPLGGLSRTAEPGEGWEYPACRLEAAVGSVEEQAQSCCLYSPFLKWPRRKGF